MDAWLIDRDWGIHNQSGRKHSHKREERLTQWFVEERHQLTQERSTYTSPQSGGSTHVIHTRDAFSWSFLAIPSSDQWNNLTWRSMWIMHTSILLPVLSANLMWVTGIVRDVTNGGASNTHYSWGPNFAYIWSAGFMFHLNFAYIWSAGFKFNLVFVSLLSCPWTSFVLIF